MEVIIDGVKYIPTNESVVLAHGIEYTSIAHWLMNVDSKLVNEWADSLKFSEKGQLPSENRVAEEKRKKVLEFRDFCDKFLGYRWDNENHIFNEVNF